VQLDLDANAGPALVNSFSGQFAMDGRNRVTAADRGVLNTGSITGTERVQQSWTLSQTGNWEAFTNDLNGDGNGTDSYERNETRTFSDANEILSRTTPSATILHDAAGEMTDDGINYRFIYDAWGRLKKITDQSGPPGTTIVEYKYNALGERIGWHYDANGSTGAPDGSDPWYWFIYDDRWRIINTYRVASGTVDTYAKERFVHHAAGKDGRSGSSYIDSLILTERDLDTTWSSAADITMEARYFYLQNWRADTCAITNEVGVLIRSYRYTAYGTRTEIDEADYNRDGTADFFDYLDWSDDNSNNRPRADINFVGSLDFYDYSDFVDRFSLAGRDQFGGKIRNLYAGYENDPVVELNVLGKANGSAMPVYESYYHVRNRVYVTELGRWTRRDPIGYLSGVDLYEYCDSLPTALIDSDGREPGRTDTPQEQHDGVCAALCDALKARMTLGEFLHQYDPTWSGNQVFWQLKGRWNGEPVDIDWYLTLLRAHYLGKKPASETDPNELSPWHYVPIRILYRGAKLKWICEDSLESKNPALFNIDRLLQEDEWLAVELAHDFVVDEDGDVTSKESAEDLIYLLAGMFDCDLTECARTRPALPVPVPPTPSPNPGLRPVSPPRIPQPPGSQQECPNCH
jgi:RHS repeat-associated protein